MATACWTDGYREQSLTPNDHGLRKCRCGNYFVLSELVPIGISDKTDISPPERVKPDELLVAIEQARSADIEIAARKDYWQHLNHPYRDRYRTHRNAEDIAAKAAWESLNPDQRTWWKKIRKSKRVPEYESSGECVVTFPPFVPTEAQQANMERLLELLLSSEDTEKSHHEIVELHRELGQFEQAEEVLSAVGSVGYGAIAKLLPQLVGARENALVRYRG